MSFVIGGFVTVLDFVRCLP